MDFVDYYFQFDFRYAAQKLHINMEWKRDQTILINTKNRDRFTLINTETNIHLLSHITLMLIKYQYYNLLLRSDSKVKEINNLLISKIIIEVMS